MVTVRTYWSLAEAGLAKSVLDNYEIAAELLDENASSYNTGAQFAVPIRLVVDEADAIRAGLILNGDFEKAAALDVAEQSPEVAAEEISPAEIPDRNPWELLLIAFYFLLPAMCLVITKFPQDAPGRWARYLIVRAAITQFLAWLGVLVAACLVAFYFWIRRSARVQSVK